MAGFSDYAENKLLDHVLGTTTFTKPTTVYVALYTAAPSDAGGGTEVSGGSYARQAATFSAASGGSTSNSAAITFPKATANWGTVVAFGIFDASTGGNLLAWNNLSPTVTVDTNIQPKFDVGDLTVTLD